jgi:hypothetical protein
MAKPKAREITHIVVNGTDILDPDGIQSLDHWGIKSYIKQINAKLCNINV